MVPTRAAGCFGCDDKVGLRRRGGRRGALLASLETSRVFSSRKRGRCLQQLQSFPLTVSKMTSEPASAHQRSPSPGALHLPEGRRTRERSPSPMRTYLIPSPLPTRRNRTVSATTRAAEGPTYSGVCKCFCRSKGHGFITPGDGGPDIFVHISDIEGEYVPVAGDEVTYKVCTIPPKNEKLQAVEVNITHLAPGTKHETWSGHVINS
ncbi:calcium-regulated heat-stable protein 1 [Python bivittatus]|uniref:Calcium-regulated heat-stable protein 1 n=1 Tax=Python bivittatus TaxID=176946 RepID=A0A9F5N1W7_PYTBI|nr:calcium-regulated heat-stable protein 1 [Python bivittatus]